MYIATAFGCIEGEMTGTKPNDFSTTGSMAMSTFLDTTEAWPHFVL